MQMMGGVPDDARHRLASHAARTFFVLSAKM